MKFINIAIAVLFVTTIFTACSKSKSSPSGSTSIEGTWVGKYGTGNNTPSSFYSFIIKPGGIIEEVNSSGVKKGEGTWKLENNIFTAKYQYLSPSTAKFSVIGAFNASTGKILGNWGYGNSATDGGLWEMDIVK